MFSERGFLRPQEPTTRIPNSGDPSVIDPGRRRFLGILAVAVAGTIAGGLMGFGLGKRSHQGNSTEQSPDAAEGIRAFETQIGNNPLTFEQVKNYIPTITALVRKETRSSKTVEELSKGIFIVRGFKKDDSQLANDLSSAMLGSGDPFAHPTIQQFMKDYPDVRLQRDLAQRIRLESILNVGWVDDDENIYLSLNNVNGENESIKLGEGLPSEVQYQGYGQVVNCDKPVPIVRVRSVITHELMHRSAKQDWQLLETEILSVYNRILKIPEDKVIGGFKKNFILRFLVIQGNSEKGIPERLGEKLTNNFNEFVTDYLASQIAIKNDLPFTLAYGRPIDLVNFRNVLSQAGISYSELYDLYRNARIKEFLLRMAESAQGINFDSEDQKIYFAMDRFNPWNYTPHWGQKIAKFAPPIQPYYPGVDTELYAYIDPTKFDTNEWEDHKLGCSYPRR